jgi:hypothetical protein
LNKRKPQTPNMAFAAGRGNVYHAGVESAKVTGVWPPSVEDPEIQGWLDLHATNWDPRKSNIHLELAVGLGHNGEYVPVVEVYPHVYLPRVMGVTVAMWKLASPFLQAEWLKSATELLITAGRADSIEWIEEHKAVDELDWKTGIWPPEVATTNLQRWAVGMASARKFGALWLRVGHYFPRDGAYDRSEWVRVDSPEWQERFEDVKAAALAGDEPKPGDNCAGCWERKACRYAAKEVPDQASA